MQLLERFPWVNVLAILACLGGAVIVIVHPDTLTYPAYLNNLSVFLGGAGVLIFAKTISGKTEAGSLAVLDAIPWAAIIGFIAAVAGLVVVIIHPETLTYSEWLKLVGKLLIGVGVFGAARAHAGQGLAGSNVQLLGGRTRH